MFYANKKHKKQISNFLLLRCFLCALKNVVCVFVLFFCLKNLFVKKAWNYPNNLIYISSKIFDRYNLFWLSQSAPMLLLNFQSLQSFSIITICLYVATEFSIITIFFNHYNPFRLSQSACMLLLNFQLLQSFSVITILSSHYKAYKLNFLPFTTSNSC